MKGADPTVPRPAKARKSPVRTRSGATVEAIYEATIQVLLDEGPIRLTTTRVTERAGISVGALYQYFPNKQALLVAILERHFDALVRSVNEVADRVERLGADGVGRPLADLAEDLADAYVSVNMARPDEAKALYAVAGSLERGNPTSRLYERLEAATVQVLAHASDASFREVGSVAFTLLSAVSGLVRATFEYPAAGDRSMARLRDEAVLVARAYLAAAADPA